jgi:hypothetical protein
VNIDIPLRGEYARERQKFLMPASTSKPSPHYTLALALGTSFTLVALLGTGLVGISLHFAVSRFNRAELAHRLSHTTGIAALHADSET